MTAPDCVRLAYDVEPRHGRAAGVGAKQGRQDPDGRGLAGAVRAEQPEDRALLDHEVDAVERADLVLAAAVDLDQALRDDRLGALGRGDHDRRGGWSRDSDSGTSDRVPVTGASGASIGAGRRERKSCPAFVASVKPRPANPRRGRSRRRAIVAVFGAAAVRRRSRRSSRQGCGSSSWTPRGQGIGVGVPEQGGEVDRLVARQAANDDEGRDEGDRGDE